MRRLSVTRVGPHTSEQRRREAAGVPLGQEVEMHAAGPNLVRVGRIFTVLEWPLIKPRLKMILLIVT